MDLQTAWRLDGIPHNRAGILIGAEGAKQQMTSIEFGDGELLVDAGAVAEGLGLTPASIPKLMREGRITSLCERGEGKDEGRIRLTFYSENRRFRLVIDEAGEILQRLKINYGDLPMRRD